MVLGDADSKLETFAFMEFEPCLKIHNLVSTCIHPKSIKLGQMANLDVILHVVVSVYRLVKI